MDKRRLRPGPLLVWSLLLAVPVGVAAQAPADRTEAEEKAPDEPKRPRAEIGRPAQTRGTLDAETVRVRAALASPVGRALDRKAQEWHNRLHRSRNGDPLAVAQVRALAAAAREARNQDAANALVAFVRLWEARASLDLAQQGLESVERALTRADALVEEGVMGAEVRDGIPARRLELRAQRLDAELVVARLNEQLARVLCFPNPGSAPAILPILPAYSRRPTDPESAVAQGLATRPEFPALHALINSLDAKTAPLARKALGAVSPLLSEETSVPPKPLLAALGCARGIDDSELDSLRHQLAELYNRRRDDASSEIRDAARVANTRLEQIGLAEERRDEAKVALEAERQRSDKGLSTFADELKRESELLQAELEVIRREAEYQIALIQLARAQGRLDLH